MSLTVRMDADAVQAGLGELDPLGDDPTVARPVSPGLALTQPLPVLARRCPTCQQAFSGDARFCPFDGDALQEAPDYNPSSDPLIGQVVDGRYEVVSVIGEGGMGSVYEVRHAALGRRFALKVLRRDIADAEHTARFIREAKAAAAIGHPNIVAVSDFGELVVPVPGDAGRQAPPVPYFVMEHLTGISLAALLRGEKPLDPARAAQIVMQCASGLAAAHAAGVVHRDLKPDNLFLTRNGEHEFVKLLDFGVAKMAGAGRLTRAGMVFGTPHYMSPEQAAGQAVDHRADVYALGVILYECLSGRVPFEADTYMGVLTKHMFATPEALERVAPDPSRLGALTPIVMRCLSKSPADRYATMAELAAELAAVLDGPLRRTGPSLRPVGRGASVDAVETPGLKPAVGPVGLGLGLLAAALVVVLVVRGFGPSHAGASAGPTASAAASSAVATPPSSAPPPSSPPASASSSPGPLDEAPPASAAAKADPAPTPARPPEQKRPRPAASARPAAKSRPGGEVVDPWSK